MFMSRLKIRTKYNLRLQKIITVSHIRLHIVPITIPHCTWYGMCYISSLIGKLTPVIYIIHVQRTNYIRKLEHFRMMKKIYFSCYVRFNEHTCSWKQLLMLSNWNCIWLYPRAGEYINDMQHYNTVEIQSYPSFLLDRHETYINLDNAIK